MTDYVVMPQRQEGLLTSVGQFILLVIALSIISLFLGVIL